MHLFVDPIPVPYHPFLPSWRSPLYLHMRPLWLALERTLSDCEGDVLDIGCGMQPYRLMLEPTRTRYVGVDRPGELSRPTVEGTAEDLPFPDEHFDVVLSTQVFEHVPDPGLALREAVRVLRPGGRLVLTVPGVWPTHEAPYDFWRFTRYGLLTLLDAHQLNGELVELGRIWATVGQMACLELNRYALLREFIPVVNVVCGLADRVSPRQDLALNWFVDARKK